VRWVGAGSAGTEIPDIERLYLSIFKMAPVEQTSFPLSVASIGELKTVEKARELPVVKDVEKYTTDLAYQISENAHVQSAKQMVESGFKSLSENETFSHFQGKVQELNENVKVKQTLDTVKEKVTGAVDHLDTMAAGVVDHLDTMAAGGLENLTAKLPALNTSTPELVETTKEVACSYASLATEYLSSFALSQIGLKLADRSLSMAEKTTKFFKADIKKNEDNLLTQTYTKLRQTRRALRAIKRAGERKNHLEKDPIARTGLVGSLASMFSLNTFLGLAGLEIVPEKKPVVEYVDTEDDGDEEHREISDLKGDLDGYKSEEDPDYKPEDDSLISTDDDSSGEESDEEADAEDIKTDSKDRQTDGNTDLNEYKEAIEY